ncbi:VOC family protein [Microbacterium sp. B2969]|uniref:VOC family protein n=1 Tax=Microbacterium alkaliflavum TaxID=3248839 RepID=A0ABW7Q6E5_9MICO
MGVRSFEHVGVIVQDLEKVAAFFELLGFHRGDTATVGGEWADRVNGLTGTRVEMVFMTTPDGSGALELSRFIEPVNQDAPTSLPSDTLGLRHIAYRVDGVEELIERVRAAGYDLVRELVNYEDIWLVCYVRGPEGLIVELGERLS